MDDRERAILQVRDTLKAYFDQVRFARAAEFARVGRFLEAEGVLAPHGQVSSDPKELDLLARIAAQQRRYPEARRLWEAALQESPGHADYQRAIERTHEAERIQGALQKGALLTLAALSLASLAMIAWGSFRGTKPATSDGKPQPEWRTSTVPPSSPSPAAAAASPSAPTPSSNP